MKCETKTCEAPAVAKLYWPGKEPMVVCYSCGLRATGVAQALGFNLHVEPLEKPTLTNLIGLSYNQLFGY